MYPSVSHARSGKLPDGGEVESAEDTERVASETDGISSCLIRLCWGKSEAFTWMLIEV